jgi:hypothetical protein
MLGEGNIGGPGTKDTNGTLQYAVDTEGKYPYLWDVAAKTWTVSKTVRNVFTMGSGGPTSGTKMETNNWMTGGSGHGGKIGPELGIGFALEKGAPTAPVMALKSCIGNRALGWDLLPPGTKSWDWTDPKNASIVYNYAGYGESPARCLKSDRGTAACKPISWKAGCQYDGDIKRANDVLADLGTYYPGATEYEVAGFFWWQGDRDSRDQGLSDEYEKNLVNMIKALRKQYNVPNAPFVTASLGQSTLPASACPGNCGGEILQVRPPPASASLATSTSHPPPPRLPFAWPMARPCSLMKPLTRPNPNPDPAGHAQRRQHDQVSRVQGQRGRGGLAPALHWLLLRQPLRPRRAHLHERGPGHGRSDGEDALSDLVWIRRYGARSDLTSILIDLSG